MMATLIRLIYNVIRRLETIVMNLASLMWFILILEPQFLQLPKLDQKPIQVLLQRYTPIRKFAQKKLINYSLWI